MDFNHSVSELVRKRVSTRAYDGHALEPGVQAYLDKACAGLTLGLLGERASFRLVDKPLVRGQKLKVTDYGFITGPRSFLMGVVTRSPRAFESYAYLLEHLVLKATDLDLQTCWLGYFHQDYFPENRPGPDEVFPAVVIVGHGADQWKGRLVRTLVRAAHRRDWTSLFFRSDFRTPLSPEACGPYAPALELVRLAPSAGNTQPWRVVLGDPAGSFHFYMKPVKKSYQSRHLHEVDIGIALCHFELGARELGLTGRWVVSDPGLPKPETDLDYRWTWLGGAPEGQPAGPGLSGP
jgi:nitroreductase